MALNLLDKSPYEGLDLQADVHYFFKKLEVTGQELSEYLESPGKSYRDFGFNAWLFWRMRGLYRAGSVP